MELYRTVAVIRVLYWAVKCVIILYCWWSASLSAGSPLTQAQDWKSCGDNLTGMGILLSRVPCPSSWHKSSYLSSGPWWSQHKLHWTIWYMRSTTFKILMNQNLNRNVKCVYVDPLITIIPLDEVFLTPACHSTTAMLTVSEFWQRLHVKMTCVTIRISAQMLLRHLDLVEIHRLWHGAGLPLLLHQVSPQGWPVTSDHVCDHVIIRYDLDRNVMMSQGCATREVQLQQHECETQVRVWEIGDIEIRLGDNYHYLEEQRCARNCVLLQLQLL